MCPQTVLWPHELFAGLWTFHRDGFVKWVLGGDAAAVPTFWRTMPQRPGMNSKPGWDQMCVPLALHGDGVAITNIRGSGSKSIDVLSWSSLLSSGKTRFTTFLIYFSFTHLVKKSGLAMSWSTFWRQLCRSLRILYDGVWPATTMTGAPDPRAGTPLAGGYYGLIYVNKGDLEWMSAHFRLAHGSSRSPCSLCRCTNIGHGQDEMPWTDVNSPPSWLPSCWTDEAGERYLLTRVEVGKWKVQSAHAAIHGISQCPCTTCSEFGFLLGLGALGCQHQPHLSALSRPSCRTPAMESIHFFNPEHTPLGGLSLFQPDWMHTKILGTDAYLLGSCLLFLVKEVLPDTEENNVSLIWAFVQSFYKEHRAECRLSRLTEDAEAPALSKIGCKSHGNKILAPSC